MVKIMRSLRISNKPQVGHFQGQSQNFQRRFHRATYLVCTHPCFWRPEIECCRFQNRQINTGNPVDLTVVQDQSQNLTKSTQRHTFGIYTHVKCQSCCEHNIFTISERPPEGGYTIGPFQSPPCLVTQRSAVIRTFGASLNVCVMFKM